MASDTSASASAGGYSGRGFYSGQNLSKSGSTSSGGAHAWHQESKVRYGIYLPAPVGPPQISQS